MTPARLLSLILAAVILALAAPAAASAANAIQTENALPGTPGWDDFASIAQQDAINGYASKTSVNHGDSIDFFVTTTAPSFTIEIFRTGYYQGIGARRVASLGTFPGVHQAIPPPDAQTGKIECHWTKTTTFTVPSNWTTGVYLAKLSASNGNKSFIVFTVRDDGGTEPILFQSSVTTYQAYNVWGGTSLYDNRTNNSVYRYPMATKVSFDRPYDPEDSNGAGQFLYFEYPYIRWAESKGYDISYITDVDTHENTNPLTSHRVFLSIGHDEYWSREMRDNVVGAIAKGVNVAFFSANSAYWQIRFEPDSSGAPDRTQVTYKDASTSTAAPGPDPMWGVDNSRVTVRWRDAPVNLPENSFLGVMYQDQVNTNGAYTVVNSSDPLYAGSGFVDGSKVPGIVGYEYDKTWNNGFQPAGVKILSSSAVVGCCEGSGSSFANSTVYTAPSGARVFASGTIQWSWALDPYSGGTANAGIQKTTSNILESFSAGGSTTAPAVALAPSSQTFGAQPVGTTSAARTETVTNTGTAALSITSIGFSGVNPADFGQTSTCGATLAAGASCTISISFTPGAAGSRSANLTIADSATGSPHNIPLTGTGTAQAVSLSPTSVSFGGQRTGTTSAARTVTLSNSGTAPLTIASIARAGTNAADFATTDTCPRGPATLAAGASCTISVTFAPSALGARSASLVITDDAVDSPQGVSLSGTGTAPAVSLTPASLGFGARLIGSTSPAQTSTLQNTGTAPLAITSIAASGDFAQTNDCPASLAAGASCTLSVTFTPSAAGPSSGSVTVVDDAAGSPHAVSLSGTGTTPAPAVSLTPASLSFGSRLVGSTSAAQTSTLKNTGSAALSIASIVASGDFAETDDCPASLAAGASCTLSVTFSPSSAGPSSGSVTVTDDAAGSPHVLSLSGTGTTPAPALAATPTSLDFGAQRVGTTGSALTTTVKNTGSATLSIASIAASGDFAQTNDCPATLAVDATCTVSVTFTPSATGARGGSVTVTDDAAGSPHAIALSGSGTAPAVSLTPASLAFGSVSTGTTSAPQTSVLKNTGTASLAIASIAAGGDFAQTNDCAASLAPGATCTLTVRFAPSANGAQTGAVTVTDDAAGSPHAVALSGTGSTGTPAASLTPASAAFGRQVIGAASAAKAFTLRSTGTAALNVASVSLTGANAGDFAQTNTCPAALDPGASCTISVTARPTAAGARAATLSVADDASGSPQTAALTATGVYLAEDFESGGLGAWTSAGTGTATVQSAQKHAGTYAAALTTASTQSISMWSSLSGGQTQSYTRFYFRWNALTGVVPIAWGTDATGKQLWEIDFRVTQRSPTVVYWNSAGTKTSFNTSSSSIPANQWHSIELRFNQGTSGYVEIWVDGTSMGSKIPNLSGAQPYARLYLANAAGGTAYFDDAYVSSTYVGP